MKRCPQCQRTYPVEGPDFCTADGARLVVENAADFDPAKTVLATGTPPPYPEPAQQQNYPPPVQQQPPPAPQPPPAAWPPPPPAQNWGNYYAPGQGYAAPPKGKGLSLTSFILGLISGVIGGLLFASYNDAFFMTRDIAVSLIIASIATGAISIILGVIALISSRQGGKALTAIGMVLSAFSIGFWIYLEVNYSILFR